VAAIGQVLAQSAPLVFINACRSAGAVPSDHQMDSWARKFLMAGAGAFVGSLWAVRDSTARHFACTLYRRHQSTGLRLTSRSAVGERKVSGERPAVMSEWAPGRSGH
jgi:CHAT domain-containing protein